MIKRRRKKVDFTEADNLAIQRCLNGEKEAYRELVDRYQRRGISIAYGYVHNIDDAQDMVQEAFVRAYKNLNRFEIGSSFVAWFSKIVVNVCIDHYRKQKKRRGVEYEDEYRRRDAIDQFAFAGNSTDLQPHNNIEQEELSSAIQNALNRLSENHRTIILLREIEGLSYEEIAESMDCNLGTVMSRLHHARKKLQEALKPYLSSAGDVELLRRAGEGVGTKRKPQES